MKTLLALAAALTFFTASPNLTVTSMAFKNNGMIPAKYTCEGQDINPPLQISHIPSGTKTLAMTVHDPDAPKPGGVTHWVIWNLPTDGKITENFRGGTPGLNSDHKNAYKGACPPDGTHHYNFKVYALNTVLNLPSGTDQAGLEKALKGHVLAEGSLTGLYKKQK